MNALGSYFGSTRITQGAGGLGQSGELMAFADGVVGGSAASPDMPGPLFAYHDGSLGADDQTAAPVDENETSSFQDGVLGERFLLSQAPSGFGPLFAYQDGSLGAYARAIGAAASNVLDLGDAGVMKELKSAMALLAPENTLTATGQQTYTSDWYTNGIWDPPASLLWQYIVSKAKSLSGKTVSADAGQNQTYPNATGVGFIVGTLAAPTSTTYGPAYVQQNMPALSAWFTAGGGQVLAPYLSDNDKASGNRAGATGIQMSSMAMWGLGAVALFGLVLILRR